MVLFYFIFFTKKHDNFEIFLFLFNSNRILEKKKFEISKKSIDLWDKKKEQINKF